uniref:Fatty acid CoA ligase n=1 Tax=Marinactinospora thermotolerans TaxID=531310 RepID=UPI00144A4C38|nr:Chain A, Fatty acid CoA ligase [Marinactinospora thermotolerans]6SQ8_B Chain B, Fatty acid CoA ligase [Marinactinospora thermotolerans]6SQ8_C Chain C, Fatty acid CoA ligase [Marinactinospora thermotolerans]6SQ8_D Chain D, Fatty acid CoA ligase [Marinactinospora thermotolerans]6SQ8_E Chain E, Fatty acid CoA ligase [Marinactinospora thermotolerans]
GPAMGYARRVMDGIGEVAVTGAGGSVTGARLRHQVRLLAHALTEAGIPPGRGVACLHANTWRAIALRLAVQAIGCHYVGLRPTAAVTEQARAIAAADSAALVFEPSVEARAADLLERVSVPVVLSLGPTSRGRDILAASVPEGTPLRYREHPEGIAVVAFTSGTTGTPKGVAHSSTAMSACVDAAVSMYGRGPWRFLIPIPLSDLGGELAQCTLATGGTVVLLEEFQPDAVLEAIERERATHVFLAPNWLYQLAEHPALPRSDLSSLRRVVYGGAPAVPSRVAAARERMGAVLMQNYGTQEAAFIAALTPDDHARRELLTAVGRPLPHVEVEIRDDSGGTLPRGAVGEVWVRSPMTMSGYWRDPERTAQVLSGGWLRTGDVGTFDEDGHLHLTDRLQDIIIVEAYNVYSRRVEHVLTEHPDVRAAAVVGVPDPDSGEAVCAAVVVADGADPDPEHLRALVRDHLGDLHVPRRVEFVRSIPVTPAGKPDKVKVRTWFTD